MLLALAFCFVGAVSFSLVDEGGLAWIHLRGPLLWSAAVLLAHFLLRRFRPGRDPYLLPIVALLAGWGLLLQDRLAPNFLDRQTLWALLAVAVAAAVAIIPNSLRPLFRYRYLILVAGLLALAATLLFGVNPSGIGAELWLPIPVPWLGAIYFQPSEILKLLMTIFLASYFAEREPLFQYRKSQQAAAGSSSGGGRILQRVSGQMPFLGPLLFMWGFCMVLLVWQQDLGAASLFFVLFVALLYLATGELAYVVGGVTLFVLGIVGAYFVFDAVTQPRIVTWLNPWPYVSDEAFQIVQSLYAVANGGVLGQGIGQGFPDFIPVVHSDFAFSAIAEEWGYAGSLVVILCFAILAQRCFRMAIQSVQRRRPHYFHAFLAAGIAIVFSAQAFLIVGGVTKLLPLTGVTLPFVSYGGSSLLLSGIMIGLLWFISAGANADEDAQR